VWETSTDKPRKVNQVQEIKNKWYKDINKNINVLVQCHQHCFELSEIINLRRHGSAATVRFGQVLKGVLSNLEPNLGSGLGKEGERWTGPL
jgi:hypothetical protein